MDDRPQRLWSDERQRELLLTKGCTVQCLLDFNSEAADGPGQQYVLEAEMQGNLLPATFLFAVCRFIQNKPNRD